MADYQFTTHWRFDAPIEQVWQEIKTMSQWPQWWPYVKKVHLLRPGGPNEIGAIRQITWHTALPYSFVIETEVVGIEEYRRIEGKATGELVGTGIWTFSSEGGATCVQYDWHVKTTKWWMNLIAPIARPFFEKNHDEVMASGFQGLTKRLGNKKI